MTVYFKFEEEENMSQIVLENVLQGFVLPKDLCERLIIEIN